LSRVRDWSNDFPDAILAPGYWGTSVSRPGPVSDEEVQPDAWLPADFEDFALIFTPQGKVVSNDIPMVNDRYHILVCSSLEYSSTSLPPSAGLLASAEAFLFHRAAAAHTIVVSPEGQIDLQDGAQGLRTEPHPFAMSVPPAPAQTRIANSRGTPVIDRVEVQAAPELDPTASVTKDGSLNIIIEASDPSGDELFVEWTSSKTSGAATRDGAFSMEGKQRMTWSPKLQKWLTEVTWKPPVDAAIGDLFEIKAAVSNSSGSSVAANSAELRDITVVENELIFLCDDTGIFSILSNGTGLKRLISAGSPWYVNISPDGSKMVWDQNAYDRDAMYVANIDGSDPRFITSERSRYYLRSHWNATGTKIYFGSSYSMIRTINPDGTGLAQLTPRIPGLSSTASFDISSDGRYIALVAFAERTVGDRTTNSSDLWLGEIDESVDPPRVLDWTNVTPSGTKSPVGGSNHFLTIHPNPPDPTKPLVVVRSEKEGYDGARVFQVEDRGTGATPRFTATYNRLTNAAGVGVKLYDISFSSDGSQACITESNFGGASLYDWDMTGVPKLTNGPKSISTRPFRWVDWR